MRHSNAEGQDSGDDDAICHKAVCCLFWHGIQMQEAKTVAMTMCLSTRPPLQRLLHQNITTLTAALSGVWHLDAGGPRQWR